MKGKEKNEKKIEKTTDDTEIVSYE